MSDDDLPISIDDLPTRCPWWPYSPWATRHRIRTGRMAAIRDGRRMYVSVALLRRYLAEHVSGGEAKREIG